MLRRLNKLVSDALHIIRAYSGSNPVVSFSGGKDSLVALDLSLKVGVRRTVFADTTIEFKDTLKYIKTVQDFYGIDIDIVHPPKSFFELMEVLGFPSRRMRWCCDVLKFGPLGKYALENQVTSFITGLRSNESAKRKNYQYVGKNPLLPVPQVNPLLNWSEKDIWDYIREFSLPVNPLYRYGLKRIGCWSCPFKTKSDWLVTKERFPDLIKKLNTKIKQISKKLRVGIRDIDDFIQKRAWTKHAFTQTSKIKGKMRIINGRVKISLKNKNDTMQVLKLLPIISRKYNVRGNTIFLNVKDVRRLKMLIEKAINCVGCGACLTLCTKNALYLNDDSISVNVEKCDMCGNCLKTSSLRGACIRRNYAPIRFEIESYSTEDLDEHEYEERFSKPCSSSDIVGVIRSRVPMQTILGKIKKLGKVKRANELFVVRNNIFKAIFKQNRGLTEVRFVTKANNFTVTVEIIRDILRKN